MASSDKQNRTFEVSNELLLSLVPELDAEWMALGAELSIPPSLLNYIRAISRENRTEAKHQVLLRWKRREGQDATHENLAKALKKVERADLSEKVQQEYTRMTQADAKKVPLMSKSTGIDGMVDRIAKEIDSREWRTVGRELGLVEDDLNSIEIAHERNIHQVKVSMLQKWRELFGKEANTVTLVQALRNCKFIKTAETLSEMFNF